MSYIVITLIVLTIMASILIMYLCRSLGAQLEAKEKLEGVLDIEEHRKEIAGRPGASAHSLLNRMRSEASDQ